jgi:hypothetical protein
VYVCVVIYSPAHEFLKCVDTVCLCVCLSLARAACADTDTDTETYTDTHVYYLKTRALVRILLHIHYYYTYITTRINDLGAFLQDVDSSSLYFSVVKFMCSNNIMV